MQTLRKHFRKLIVTAVLALAVSALTTGSYASTYEIIATSSDGSYAARSCGSSAGKLCGVRKAQSDSRATKSSPHIYPTTRC